MLSDMFENCFGVLAKQPQIAKEKYLQFPENCIYSNIRTL